MLGALDSNSLPNISGCLAPLISKYFKFNCSAANEINVVQSQGVSRALHTCGFSHDFLEQLCALFIFVLFNRLGSVALFTAREHAFNLIQEAVLVWSTAHHY